MRDLALGDFNCLSPKDFTSIPPSLWTVEVIVVHSEKKGNRCNYARIIEYIDNTSARQNVITAPL
jgi:hypothetical protein